MTIYTVVCLGLTIYCLISSILLFLYGILNNYKLKIVIRLSLMTVYIIFLIFLTIVVTFRFIKFIYLI